MVGPISTSMTEPIYIDQALLDQISSAAKASPRLRRNHNFHQRESEPCNRMLNAIEPDSYVAPHRHLDPNKDETFIVVRGAFGLVLFDQTGDIRSTRRLAANSECVGATVPHGTYHTILSLAPGSVFVEAKAGPYAPLALSERAAWAPAENEAGARLYLDKLRLLFD